MQLTRIDPNERYVLVMPEAKKEFAMKLTQAMREFVASDEKFMAIFGTDVTIVPANQVVGYTTLETTPQ